MKDTGSSQATSLDSSQRDAASARRARGADAEAAGQVLKKYSKKPSSAVLDRQTSNANSETQNQDALGSTSSYMQASHQNYLRHALSGEGEVMANMSESLEGDRGDGGASLARGYAAAPNLPVHASRGAQPVAGLRAQLKKAGKRAGHQTQASNGWE